MFLLPKPSCPSSALSCSLSLCTCLQASRETQQKCTLLFCSHTHTHTLSVSLSISLSPLPISPIHHFPLLSVLSVLAVRWGEVVVQDGRMSREGYRVRERMGTQRKQGGRKAGEEAKRPGEAALQGLLTCRLHISELQSILISPCWVTEALPFSLCACLSVHCLRIPVQMSSCMHVLHFNMCARAFV